MFGWLRDTLTTTSSTPFYRHSMIPSSFIPKSANQKQTSRFSPFDEDEEDGTDEDSNDNSFYHNPYHSSGLMNYTDVPQQQYTSEHNYPTYLTLNQPSDHPTNDQTIDDQIYSKLVSLQQRAGGFQPYAHRQYDYAYRNRTISSPRTSFTSNVNIERNHINGKTPSEEEEEEKVIEQDDDYRIRTFYPGQYPTDDEHFDLASVVLWYRNAMQSVKKFM